MTQDALCFTPVHTLTNRFEADLLLQALEQEGIPTMLRSFEETPYDGLFVAQRGWGKILVPPDQVARAREVIAALLDHLKPGMLYVDLSELDPLLWQRLRAAEPLAVCAHTQAEFEPSGGTYRIPFFDTTLICDPQAETIQLEEDIPHFRVDFELGLVLLHHLLEAEGIVPSGNWISEKDLAGGEIFFQGPHAFPVQPILKLVGPGGDLLEEGTYDLGGTPVEMGDQAYRFEVFPRVPVLLVFWRGDDEFGPDLRVRLDKTILRQIHTLDTVFALVNVVCRSFRAALKNLLGGEPL